MQDNTEISKSLKRRIIRIIAKHFYNNFYSYNINKKQAKLIAEDLWEDFSPQVSENRNINRKEILGLLKLAREDLDSAKILYSAKKYRQAIFLLQQSVEKATKAICLYNGIINETDLYGNKNKDVKRTILSRIWLTLLRRQPKKEERINHTSPKAFILLLKRKKISGVLYKSLYKQKGNDIKSEINNVEAIIDKQNKLAIISKEDISHFINDSEAYLFAIQQGFSRVDRRELKGKLKLFAFATLKEIKKNFGEQDIFTTLEKKFQEMDISELLEMSSTSTINLLPLWPLSIITYPHAVKARYDYNLDYGNLGIVLEFTKITDLLNKVLSNFESDKLFVDKIKV